MAPEHRFLDMQRPVGSDDPDSELRETLERMGAEGWELAAVLPTDHVNTDSGGYVVSSMRLFFKGATDRMQIDEGVYERSGVQVPFPGKGHAHWLFIVRRHGMARACKSRNWESQSTAVQVLR